MYKQPTLSDYDYNEDVRRQADEAGSIAVVISINILIVWFLFSGIPTPENAMYMFVGSVGVFFITLFGTAYIWLKRRKLI